MAAIFLSYARKDRAFAEKLARVLEGAGHNVWWDRRIGGGEEFGAEIEAELAKSEVVLVAWSGESVKSRWVRDEAAVGGDRGILVPVCIDGSLPPMGFRQFHTLDLSDWRGGKRDKLTADLLHSVNRRLKKNSRAPQLAEAEQQAKPRFVLPMRKSIWAIAAALVLVLATVASLFVLRSYRAETEPASLAVLPFKNMSAGDPYFAEGVAEEIANQLGREPQFKVAGRTSSALFKDAADVRDVGRRLHVAYVLEGSVRSAGDEVRIAVSLVDTRRGSRLWSQNFRGRLDNIFAIQDQIGQQVAVQVKRRLVAKGAGAALVSTGEVYRLYVTAKSMTRLREPEKLVKALGLLQRAVKLDPNYAPAWTELALVTQLSHYYGREDESDALAYRPEIVRQAEHAIALAPQFARGHAVLGTLLSSYSADRGRQRRGKAELEQSVNLDPNDAEAWYWLHNLRVRDLDFQGALAAIRRTAEIDPFFVFSNYYPDLAWEMGDHQGALSFLLERAKDHPQAYIREQARQQVAVLQRNWSAAYLYGKRARELAPPDMKAYDDDRLGIALLRAGLLNEAAEHLPDFVAILRSGKAPPLSQLSEGEPPQFWRREIAPLFGRLLINTGRARDLVSLYDRAFSSPSAMRSGLADDRTFVQVAPMAAAGLLEIGRSDDATGLLKMTDALCGQAMRKGRTTWDFQIMCTHAWAMLGQRDRVVRTLNGAIAAGWRPTLAWSSKFTDEPVYKRVADEPRLKQLGLFLAAEIDRERRELLAAGV